MTEFWECLQLGSQHRTEVFQVAFNKDFDTIMSRLSLLKSPLLLGFEDIERVLDQVSKSSADGYPPYNIERNTSQNGAADTITITLAVAGFEKDQLDIQVEDNQLVIQGRQQDEPAKEYLHRGIAARQFVKKFVLADGIQVDGATMQNGLLSIKLRRPEPEKLVQKIKIQ